MEVVDEFTYGKTEGEYEGNEQEAFAVAKASWRESLLIEQVTADQLLK